MVGGSAAAFARAQPILAAMGRTIVHTGPAGNGQAVKICNNMLLAISMIGICEAFTLAQKLGLAPQTLFDVVSKSTGQCWALTGYCPVPGPVPASPANRDYARGFYRGDDAEGSAAGAAGGRVGRGADAAGRGGGGALSAVCRSGTRRSRLLGDLSLYRQS